MRDVNKILSFQIQTSPAVGLDPIQAPLLLLMELVKDNLFVFFFDLFFCFVIIIISILLPGSGPVHTSRQLDVKIVKAVQLGRNADHHSDDK